MNHKHSIAGQFLHCFETKLKLDLEKINHAENKKYELIDSR